MSLLNLTNDQKYLLEFYINNYNENLRQIDLLYLNNELIFQHISNITGINASSVQNNSLPRNNLSARDTRNENSDNRSSRQMRGNTYRQEQRNNQRNQETQNPASHTNEEGSGNTSPPNTRIQPTRILQRRREHNNGVFDSRFLSLNRPLLATANYVSPHPNNDRILTSYEVSFPIPLPIYDSSSNNVNRQPDIFDSIFEDFFSSVIVHPSQEQISRATKVLKYSEISEPKNISCPISLESFQPEAEVTQIIGCEHLFSTQHIQRWFLTNTVCPLCRYDIRNFE
jgi:hypothetical protein